jgi:hypothetical protein
MSDSNSTVRNVYLADGSWAGCFIDKAAAVAWLESKNIDPASCEISKRRPERTAKA